MASSFVSLAGSRAFASCAPLFRECCSQIDQHRFVDARAHLEIAAKVHSSEFASESDDSALRELFALGRFIGFLRFYTRYWELVLASQFEETWGTLQDAVDALRDINRFSAIDISFFESQLLAIETTYPYKLFASIGAVSDFTECSICGKDIEDFECEHRRGELYAGRMAVGIVRQLRLEHISLVTNPADKRCVMRIQGQKDEFPALEFMRDELRSGRLRIGWIERFEWSERSVARTVQPRNSQCSCGSGKKYKKCCISSPLEKRKHVELVPLIRELQSAVG